jgi:hypothetical protein
MFFDIPLVVDWRKIGERRQSLTNRGNQRKNAKQIDYNYKVGDKKLVINSLTAIWVPAETKNYRPLGFIR